MYHLRVQISQDTRLDLNFDQVDWLHEPRLRGQLASVKGSPGGGDDLSTTPMDSVSVQGDIMNVETNVAHILVGQATLEKMIKIKEINDHLNFD